MNQHRTPTQLVDDVGLGLLGRHALVLAQLVVFVGELGLLGIGCRVLDPDARQVDAFRSSRGLDLVHRSYQRDG